MLLMLLLLLLLLLPPPPPPPPLLLPLGGGDSGERMHQRSLPNEAPLRKNDNTVFRIEF
jgi:hypothetical protein